MKNKKNKKLQREEGEKKLLERFKIFGGTDRNRVVPHQWCALFYRLLHSSTQHIEKVEGGERDTQLVHVNEATAA